MGSAQTVVVRVKKSAGNKGNKNRKYGRNKVKCQKYRANAKREMNKKSRWEKQIKHWRKIGGVGMEKQAAFLQGKLDRQEYRTERKSRAATS